MGEKLSLQALQKGMRVAGFEKGKTREDLLKAGLVEIKRLEGFRKELAPPRAVFVYIPAGPGVDGVLDELVAKLEKGDILVDGGNSYWGDSIRRSQLDKERGLFLVDLGTSGGVRGPDTAPALWRAGIRKRSNRLSRSFSISSSIIPIPWRLRMSCDAGGTAR